MNIIEVKNLEYQYEVLDDNGDVCGANKVLFGVDLDVPEGQFLAVLGHNGSGKSTLAKHFNGILTPTAGCVQVCGMDTTSEEDIYTIRQNVGMVFQNPDNQIVATIVEEDVAFALENIGTPPPIIRERVDEALKTIGMYKYRMHAPHKLSGGQKQRVAIAGIIALKPRCIVLDEPTAMLDPKGRKEVMKTIKMLNREFGITIVYITHYMEEASQADRVIVMDNGRILMDDIPKRIFARVDELKEVGLDVPQVTELMYYLRKDNFPVPLDIIDENEGVEAIIKAINDKSCKVKPRKIPNDDGDNAVVSAVTDNAISVETRNLTYKYSVGTPFEVTAVNDVSIAIKKGDFIGIIGHTGSGKSTLIQHLNGLLKQTSGEVLINGLNIWSKDVNIRDIRFEVGLVFQYSEHQLFEETVYKDIAFGPNNMKLSKEEVDKRVLFAAEVMGVHKTWLSRSPFDLSGGQKRRVALAGVIAMEPHVLILDEPAAGLDPKGREKVLAQVKLYHQKTGNTVLLVSHSMEDIVRFAQKVIVMNEGKVFAYDTVDEIFSRSDDIINIGLDVPQITRLAKALKQRGVDLGNDIYTVQRMEKRILEAHSRPCK